MNSTLWYMLIGLAVAAAIAVLVIVVVITMRKTRSLSSGKGYISIVKDRKTETKDLVFEISLPSNYTEKEMTELMTQLAKVDEGVTEKYPADYITAVAAVAVALFIYQQAKGKEVKLEMMGLVDAEKTILKTDFYEGCIDPLVQGLLHGFASGTITVATVLSLIDLPQNIAIVKTWTTGKLISFAPDPVSGKMAVTLMDATSFQSCGEGGCGSPFTPFATLGEGKDSKRIFYGAAPRDRLTEPLLVAHQRETMRTRTAGFSPNATMIAGSKTVQTPPSGFYAWLPGINRQSSYLSDPSQYPGVADPSQEELRPSPANMRLHRIGAYDEFPLFTRSTSEGREQVYDASLEQAS